MRTKCISIAVMMSVLILVSSNRAGAGRISLIKPDMPIQNEIDNMSDGDELHLSSGTYHQTFDFHGKAIHVLGVDGPLYTIIDGGGKEHVVQCTNGEGPGTVLEGVTITNGHAGIPDGCGGGMFVYSSSPTVINCTFRDNRAEYGGGLYSGYGSNITVTGCSFEFNTAGVWGAGCSRRQGHGRRHVQFQQQSGGDRLQLPRQPSRRLRRGDGEL